MDRDQTRQRGLDDEGRVDRHFLGAGSTRSPAAPQTMSRHTQTANADRVSRVAIGGALLRSTSREVLNMQAPADIAQKKMRADARRPAMLARRGSRHGHGRRSGSACRSGNENVVVTLRCNMLLRWLDGLSPADAPLSFEPDVWEWGARSERAANPRPLHEHGREARTA